ncbi:ferredoxin [Streptomyces albus subsp. chlorinus]|uniref:ferredoxin n=1 Tax=Streptomyces albus TaxID=1888 RepID=UPI00156FAACB|nr:ferredoxin [Streptomyces albus]NSC21474.1 ferredoxin [Streptomyces albus subsp. chlorinus]
MTAAGRWHVEVDHNLCIGSGMCVGTAPGEFRLDAARRSRPLAPDRAPCEDVLAAAESCPVEAISITLAGTGEAVFPPEE